MPKDNKQTKHLWNNRPNIEYIDAKVCLYTIQNTLISMFSGDFDERLQSH